jgi:hypothetical protein
MRRVLLLGGYGGFGARIAERLRKAGFEVLVAGRSLARAEAFCAGRPGLIPLGFDRGHRLEEVLRSARAWAVVDAAGPFQGADYRVAEAAIMAGCHYLDIADGRTFVGGIKALDAAAREQGVTVISGASSLPALSGAVVRRLAHDLDDVRAIEIVLSASSRGTAGKSVARATLSYLGEEIKIWHGGRWTSGFGWQEIKRRHFELPGVKALRGRLVALADVPDLEALPDRFPGRPATTFRAGTDMAFHNLGLWLLSWPVRWGWIGNLARWTPFISWLQRATRWASSPRSAMMITIKGRVGARRVERRWTLIAERGDGPEIPALAVPILLAKLESGEVLAGARDAGNALRLEEFDAAFAALSLCHATAETEQPPPLYARLMGDRFSRLPEAMQRLHGVLGDGGAHGYATVQRGRHRLAHLVAGLFRFPAAGAHEVHVAFKEERGVERWERSFSGRRFSSTLSDLDGLLVERFGPLRFGFDLPSNDRGLTMRLRRWWLGPIPLPLALAPRSAAREWEEEGRFHFDVAISMPLVGTIVHYRGWLTPSECGGRGLQM